MIRTSATVDESQFLSKATILLEDLFPNDPYFDERITVACVLLTRVENERAIEGLCGKYDAILVPFIERLCCSQRTFLRLATVLVSKCKIFSGNKKALLGLLEAFQAFSQAKQIMEVDVMVVSALHDCLDAQPENAKLAASVVDAVWLRFQNAPLVASSQIQDGDDGESTHDWDLLSKTMIRLVPLQREASMEETWHSTVMNMMKHYGPVACSERGPVYFFKLVLHSSPSLDPLGWNEVVLLCTRALSQSPDQLSKWLHKNNENDTGKLIALLLAHTATPNVQKNEKDLRPLAYDTIACLVETCGWAWMGSNDSATTNLGKASFICGFLRMASGEWRIQLGMAAESGKCEQAANGVLDSCGRVLVAGMAYIVELAQDESSDPLPLSGAALLHVRHSLRDALHTTIEYFVLESMENVVDSSLAPCRVLGAMLNEFLDDVPNGMDSALIAFNAALSIGQKDVISMSLLLPCLVSIFSVVELRQLQQDGLTEDVVPDAILAILTEARTEQGREPQVSSCVTWSCHALELWFDVDQYSNKKRRRLLTKALLPWIQFYMDERTTSSPQQVLPLVVGCYMTLLGDVLPTNEQEQHLVVQALRRMSIEQ